MKKNRQQMMEDVAKRWGLEHINTINFCEQAESQEHEDFVIECIYNHLMEIAVFDEDE